MGNCDLDPALRKRRTWNAGRNVAQSAHSSREAFAPFAFSSSDTNARGIECLST